MNISQKTILFTILLTFGLAQLVYAASFDLEQTEKLNLSTQGIESLDITAGAGFLKIEGVQGLTQIEVIAELKVDKDNYRLLLEKEGSKAVLQADANTKSFGSWFGSDSPRIDLTIKIPENLELIVDDGSGLIHISNINGNVKITDGSGEIVASNLGGNLQIIDGSGDIKLVSIKGSVNIDDGSGEININSVESSIEIEDGSGDIIVSDVKGDLKVEDGSGEIEIKSVSGHVTIDDGSGDIVVDLVKGGLTIVEAGSGGLSITNVDGKVTSRR